MIAVVSAWCAVAIVATFAAVALLGCWSLARYDRRHATRTGRR